MSHVEGKAFTRWRSTREYSEPQTSIMGCDKVCVDGGPKPLRIALRVGDGHDFKRLFKPLEGFRKALWIRDPPVYDEAISETARAVIK
jgi:hypothetical protein